MNLRHVILVSILSTFQTLPAFAQSQELKLPSTTALSNAQVKQVLEFSPGEFKSLKGQWLTKSLKDNDLLTLGKGWVSTEAPLSDESNQGLAIMKGLAQKGSSEASLTLGIFASDPSLRAVVGDPGAFFAEAADTGSPLGLQAYGNFLLTPGTANFDPFKGYSLLTKSVLAGNVTAAPDLAIAYEFGLGVDPDSQKSEQWFKTGADSGQVPLILDYAQYKLRHGFKVSDETVMQLYRKAADLGDPSSQFVLASDQLERSTSADGAEKALNDLSALAAKDDMAKLKLADYALAPKFGVADPGKAEFLYQEAAKNGNITALGKLGNFYITKFSNQPEKVALGRQLLFSAVNAGDPNAIVMSATTAVSPELSSIERYSRGLSGLELSAGTQKHQFDQIVLSSCNPVGAAAPCRPIPVFYFTNRKAQQSANGVIEYLNEIATDGKMRFGTSLASVPVLPDLTGGAPPTGWWDVAFEAVKSVSGWNAVVNFFSGHDPASVQAPNDTFQLHNLEQGGELRAFASQLHDFATSTHRQKAFVYVHGFANSFEAAVDRMALLSQQYNYPGVPIVFSWASANTPIVDASNLTLGEIRLGYINDLRMVKRSCGAFQSTLEDLVDAFGSGNVMILAHSMGSELVMDMLTACAGGRTWGGSVKLGPLVFAAPDVDQGEFQQESTIVVKRAAPVAVYASRNDLALAVSAAFEGNHGRRAGQAGTGLLIAPPVQTIDASRVEGSPSDDPFNHAYVFDVKQVRQDVIAIMRGIPLDQRDCITNSDGKRDPPGTIIGSSPTKYWILQPNCL